MKEFGELIQLARERRGIRAYDLAYALGQTPSWLSRIENGGATHPPSPAVMDLLSNALGLSIVEMFAAMGYAVGGSLPDRPPVNARVARLAERLALVPATDKNLTALERIVDALVELRPNPGEAVQHDPHPGDNVGIVR